MSNPKSLGDLSSSRLLLLAAIECSDVRDVASVRQWMDEVAGIEASYGVVCTTLWRMVDSGHLAVKRKGKIRSATTYRLTRAGINELDWWRAVIEA